MIIDTNLLLGYYQSRYGGAGTAAPAGGAKTASGKYAPTPPWDSKAVVPRADALVKSALLGRGFIDEGAAQLDLPGASDDYKKLFALYQGLNALYGLGERMDLKGVTEGEKTRVAAAFNRGLAETAAYIDTLKMEEMRLTRGEATERARTMVGVAKPKYEYTTGVLQTGSSSAVVPALEGNIKFDIKIKRLNTIVDVAIDLNQMGSTPRTMANVINFMNGKLADTGMATRFATQRIAAEPRTVQVGGKTVTLPAGQDSWALKVKGDSSETITFSATETASAVYMAQTAGDPDPDNKPDTADSATVRQFLKIQTDLQTGAPPAAVSEQGATYRMDGQVFATTLGPEVGTVRATAMAADGSVFMLADVTAPTDGQAIKGTQDVALLKYDSAGTLLYARTLGAAETASGMALAVSADGKVAVAGSVSGALIEGSEGLMPDTADSFVTVFNAAGEEEWTQRRAARSEDEASAVAFGADGTVYVAGRAKSAMPGATAVGGWDNYLTAVTTNAKGEPVSLFTRQFGTVGNDKVSGIVVDGTNVVVAGVENGHAVVRRFTGADTASPTLAATRDLGDLQGGDLAGIALDGGEIVLAGSTRNAALSAGTITHAHAGGIDAFAARLSSTLTAGGGDALAYLGGTGDDRATALAVSGGKVWIAGGAGNAAVAGLAPVGEVDGFLVRLDVDAGAVEFSRRFTAKDNQAAPTAIAVDATGASSLDRLGLPKGTLAYTDSQKVTAATAARAGDQFQIRSREGGKATTVTIDAADTLETLAAKVRRAAGFQAKVEIVPDGDFRRLQIKPLNSRSTIEILGGKTGRDALEALGLAEGVVRATKVVDGKTVSADGGGPVYGLKLARDLDLSSKAAIKRTLTELSEGLGAIRAAYRDLEGAAKPASAAAKPTGPVPAYLSAQLANYQAALSRLGGG